MEERVSIEDCLGAVPNKFELTVFAMNRAKELLLGASSEIPDGRYTKKQVNKALKEIEEGILDISLLKEKVKKFITNNDLFLKDTKTSNADSEDDGSGAEDGELVGDDLKDIDLDEEDDNSFDLSASDGSEDEE
jgi:DNA-directed RNA polymerase subunit omega